MKFDSNQNYLKKELYQLIKDETSIFEFIQEGSLDGIWYRDLENTDNEWMSPGFWKTLGYDPADKRHLTSEWQNIIFQDDLRTALDNFNKHCADPNHPYDQIVRYRHFNGSTIWIRCRGIAIRDENGKPIRMLGAHTNVTEIKEKEEHVNKLKQRFELVFNGTHDIMALVSVQKDRMFTYALINRAFLQQFSLSEDKVLGESPQSVFGNESGARIVNQYIKCIETRKTIIVDEAIEFSGSILYFQTTIAPIIEDEIKHIVVSRKDITELKHSIHALQEETNNINAIFESSPVAMLLLDESTNVISVNNAAVKLCGGNIADVLHHRPGDAMGCLHSYDDVRGCGYGPDCSICPLRRGVESLINSSGGRIHRAEVQVTIKRKGELQNVWLDVGAETIFVNGNRQVCVALDDITNRKRLEKDIIVYHDNLEKTNKALNERLKQTLEAISKIGEMRDLYTAGHQKRVKELACAIAFEIGLAEEIVKNIAYGALIHDIGKIQISSDIINKSGKISNIEYQILQTHVDYSYDIVKDIDFPCSVIEMIHQHHERLDGTGYPQGLSGDQIILESRILAVADVIEAMNSHRPYRAAKGIDVALEEILKNKGTKYDADVVDVCIKLFREKRFAFEMEKTQISE